MLTLCLPLGRVFFLFFFFTLYLYCTPPVAAPIRAHVSTSARRDIFPTDPSGTVVLCGLKMGPSRICAAGEGEKSKFARNLESGAYWVELSGASAGRSVVSSPWETMPMYTYICICMYIYVLIFVFSFLHLRHCNVEGEGLKKGDISNDQQSGRLPNCGRDEFVSSRSSFGANQFAIKM